MEYELKCKAFDNKTLEKNHRRKSSRSKTRKRVLGNTKSIIHKGKFYKLDFTNLKIFSL